MSDLKSSDRAYRRFSASLGAIIACVTTQHHVVRPYVSRARRAHEFFLPLPAGLQANEGGRSGFRFDLQQVVLFLPERSAARSPWRTELQSYEYRLLDQAHRELLVYHWQPDSAGPSHPHLHVSASLDAQFDARTRRSVDLDKRHLATGSVSLQAVVRMLISEFAIRPLRDDWEERLSTPAVH